MTRKPLLIALGAVLAAGLLIQLIPAGVDNPPVSQEPEWNAEATRELAERACFDCHSNETKTPWYGHIAPVSWVVSHHVEEGREHFNLSEMDKPQDDAHEAGEELEEGEMPPRYYLLTHPEARLSEAEKRALVEGLDATFGGEEEH